MGENYVCADVTGSTLFLTQWRRSGIQNNTECRTQLTASVRVQTPLVVSPLSDRCANAYFEASR